MQDFAKLWYVEENGDKAKINKQIYPWTSMSAYNFKALSKIKTEKAMAPHSSTLAWKIPWTEEPGRLQSLGSLRVRHD